MAFLSMDGAQSPTYKKSYQLSTELFVEPSMRSPPLPLVAYSEKQVCPAVCRSDRILECTMHLLPKQFTTPNTLFKKDFCAKCKQNRKYRCLCTLRRCASYCTQLGLPPLIPQEAISSPPYWSPQHQYKCGEFYKEQNYECRVSWPYSVSIRSDRQQYLAIHWWL